MVSLLRPPPFQPDSIELSSAAYDELTKTLKEAGWGCLVNDDPEFIQIDLWIRRKKDSK